MVRTRFARLAPEQQRAIERAALDEFAAHGFHDASLNRVIETAGISKGSMYYYFDGKEDLYAHVLRTELGGLLTRLGPLELPDDGGPDGFWNTLQDYYLRAMTALIDSPQLAALLRGWMAAAASPGLQQAQRDMERDLMPWLEQAVAIGQRVGAVRADLPSALLIAVVLGMGQAMDLWLITQQPTGNDLPPLIDALAGMIRGAVRPLAGPAIIPLVP